MKSLKDIEKLGPEELDAVSLDESIVVPESFTDRVGENMDAVRKMEILKGEKRSGRLMKTVGIAAAAAAVAGIGFATAGWTPEPKDTFDDPYLAYAELEKAFETMSESVGKGLAMAGKSEEIIDRTVSVFSE